MYVLSIVPRSNDVCMCSASCPALPPDLPYLTSRACSASVGSSARLFTWLLLRLAINSALLRAIIVRVLGAPPAPGIHPFRPLPVLLTFLLRLRGQLGSGRDQDTASAGRQVSGSGRDQDTASARFRVRILVRNRSDLPNPFVLLPLHTVHNHIQRMRGEQVHCYGTLQPGGEHGMGGGEAHGMLVGGTTWHRGEHHMT